MQSCTTIRRRATETVSPLWFLQQMFLPWHGGLCAKLHEDPPSFKSCRKAAVVGPPLPWDWPLPLPCLLYAGSIPQGHAGQGRVSRLPFQSKSQKSRSLCLINKIPALFTALVAQFTGTVDRVFFLLGLEWVTAMKEDPRMLINRYCNLQKGGPKSTALPAIGKSGRAGLRGNQKSSNMGYQRHSAQIK